MLDKFNERMKALLGDDYSRFSAGMESPPEKAFRVNTKKITVQDFEKLNPFGGERVPYVPGGYYLQYEKAGNHPYHHAGMIYIQDPGAMSAAACITPGPGWHVLDLCAAPGGKTSQLADKIPDGVIVSNEIVPSRCRTLMGNVERLGLENTVVTCCDAKRLSSLFGEEFDLVVADVPCSGEGMLRKSENARNEWSDENVAACARRQKEILSFLPSMIKENGYLLYSTCTFSLEENEKQMDDFLSGHPEFEAVRVNPEVEKYTADGIVFDGCRHPEIKYFRRFYPHIARGEGQFAALLRKRSGTGITVSRPGALSGIPLSERKTVFGFLDSVLTSYNEAAVKKYKDNVVYFDRDFAVPQSAAFGAGVTVGTVQKGVLRPHHQFFSAMGDRFIRRIDVDLEGAEKYLSGNTLSCSCGNGWAAVTLEGCSLGGAKCVDGTAKNHYPKGLRLL